MESPSYERINAEFHPNLKPPSSITEMHLQFVRRLNLILRGRLDPSSEEFRVLLYERDHSLRVLGRHGFLPEQLKIYEDYTFFP